MTTKNIAVNGEVFPCPIEWTVEQARYEIRSRYGIQGGGIEEDGLPLLGNVLIDSVLGALVFVGGRLIPSAELKSHYLPSRLQMRIMGSNIFKGLRPRMFAICLKDTVLKAIRWNLFDNGLKFDLSIDVIALDQFAAEEMVEEMEELCTTREIQIISIILEKCDHNEETLVIRQLRDLTKVRTKEYTPTRSVDSVKEYPVSKDVELRMIEDATQSYIKVGLVVRECKLVPQYKYPTFANDPMNHIVLSLSMQYPFHNSEISVHDSFAVPKFCVSLAKDEFPGKYENAVVRRNFSGANTEMTEVFLVILLRGPDEEFLTAMLTLLRPGSRREGSTLVTSVFIRHKEENLEKFEFFVREHKKHTIALWRKNPYFSDEAR